MTNINPSSPSPAPTFVKSANPPTRIFIVPYRNRIEQKFFFSKQMSFILEDDTDYEIYFSHQNDDRTFNRGATKNIGFLAMKCKYPNDYKNMTFIFNDVDTLPFHKIFNYQTEPGIVKHYYGFKYALGGIVVIKGDDFERTNGYPNYWGWGNEDSGFQKRCLHHKLQIDRSQFYPIGSPEILQLFDGVKRLISHRDYQRNQQDDGQNGLTSINKLAFSINKESKNPVDNKYIVESSRFFVVNISSFLTSIHIESDAYHEYDLREPVSNIVNPKQAKTEKKNIAPNEWKNLAPTVRQSSNIPIPTYPFQKPINSYSPQYASPRNTITQQQQQQQQQYTRNVVNRRMR